MARNRISRNAPCPCGSGKKYKHCCYGKGVEDDLGLGSGRQQPQYPLGTVALYGPDDKTTTKIAAGVILHDGAEPILQRWVTTDVTTSREAGEQPQGLMLVARQRKTWAFSPPKPPPPPVPDDLKAEVEFIKPPPKNWRWNHIIDIQGRLRVERRGAARSQAGC